MKKEDNFSDSLFVLNFIGQEMDLLINLYHRVEQGTEEGVMLEQSPISIRGFILDVDENYVYIGNTPDGITKFVRKDAIVGGDIVDHSSDLKVDDDWDDFPTDGSVN